LSVRRHLYPGLSGLAEDVRRRFDKACIVERPGQNDNSRCPLPLEDNRRATVETEPTMHWLATHSTRFSVSFQVSGDSHSLSGHHEQSGESRSRMPLTGLAVAGHHGHGHGIGCVLNLPAKALSRHVWHFPLPIAIGNDNTRNRSLRKSCSGRFSAWRSPSETNLPYRF
jgi:hypothetical protein